MKKDEVMNSYFEWLYGLITDERDLTSITYRKLLMFLHSIEFVYSIDMDGNRAIDGIDLRDDFEDDTGINTYGYLEDPCSVLEMMIALAKRCDETIMDNPNTGSRIGQWFWSMINNLGLGRMDDKHFNKRIAVDKIHIFLDRRYDADGKGGLFTIKNCKYDLRDVEIWYQLNWYLNEILEEEQS